MKTMKKLRRMVSVILCVVISCMCFVTPVCAVNEAEVNSTAANIGNYGIVQVRAYPVILNEDTGEAIVLEPPAKTAYYSGGAFLVNLTIPDMLQGIYNTYGCNCWLYEIEIASSSGVTSIVANINNGELKETIHSTGNYTYSFYVPDDDYYDYLKYEFIWYWSDGTNFVSGGHISRS